ncbi:MAG: alpha/beta fold hydrolase [Chloroflexi bacterium]|nr:alpha/beta fold hydrolase [Chloroflexota bacterium]
MAPADQSRPKTLRLGGRLIAYDCPVAPSRRQGLPLLFVHSSSFDRTIWRPLLERFTAAHTPIAIDLPGHGDSEGPACERIEHCRDFVKALADALDLERIVLIGHSFGGAIAQDYALAYPSQVRALALISTSLKFGTKPEQIEHWRGNLSEFKRIKEQTAEASEDATLPVLKALRDYRARIPLESQLADMAAMSQWSNEARFAETGCPIALITGDRDMLLDAHKRMHGLAPHATMVVLPRLGHLMVLEQPGAIADAIARWLATLPR